MVTDPRRQIEKLIQKKASERDTIRCQREELAQKDRDLAAKDEFLVAQVEALQEALKLIPREAPVAQKQPVVMKPGSGIEKAYIFLRTLGRPAYIKDILEGTNNKVNSKTVGALAGTLRTYAKEGRFFTITAPNTFGLLEFAADQPTLNGEMDLPLEASSV